MIVANSANAMIDSPTLAQTESNIVWKRHLRTALRDLTR
jgi:hypothetical protein